MANIISKLVPGNGTTEYGLRSGYLYYGTTAGSGSAYTVTIKDHTTTGNTISIDSYQPGLTIALKFHTAPTTANPTLNVNGKGAVTLKYGNGDSVQNKIVAGALYLAVYVVVSSTGYFYLVHSYDTASTSTDEKLTVGTLTDTDTMKYVVMHNGGGTNATGYTSPYFRYQLNTSRTLDNMCELVLGRANTIASTVGNGYKGSIGLYCDNGDGNDAFIGYINPPASGVHTNRLPSVDGTLLSSGGLLSSTSTTINNNLQDVTYYKCLSRGNGIYAPAMGSGGGTTTDTNDYPETASWANGTANGPVLTLSSSTTNFPSLSCGAIPSASSSQSGIVTTGTQTFAGAKTFSSAVTASSSLLVTSTLALKSNVQFYNGSALSSTVTRPAISGAFLTSGGLLTSASPSVNTNVLSTTYYQCLYRSGKIYAPYNSSSGGSSVSFSANSSMIEGLNLGILTIGTNEYDINVRPARIDCGDEREWWTRQGVVRPYFETTTISPYWPAENYENHYKLPDGMLHAISFNPDEVDLAANCVAIPVFVDFHINGRDRMQSVPYVILPKNIFGEEGEAVNPYGFEAINTSENQTDPE